MVCAVKGYPFVALMSDSFSIERRKLMRILGAKVVLAPAAERGTGMVKKAEELAKKNGWFLARQFENPANPEYHRNTTGPEILRDFVGKRLDWWVTGYGTGGTLTGAGDMLRKARPEMKIVVVEPEGAALLAGQRVEAPQDPGLDAGLHPGRPEPQGLRRDRHGRATPKRATPRATSRRRKGSSAGSPPAGPSPRARKVAEKAPKGSVLLAMLPDTGERYLSTILFEGINEGTDEVPGMA